MIECSKLTANWKHSQLINGVKVCPRPTGFEALENLKQMKQNALPWTTVIFIKLIDQVQIWITYFKLHRSCSTYQVLIKMVSFRLDLWDLRKYFEMRHFKRLFSGHQIYWFKLCHQAKKTRQLFTAFVWKLNGTVEVDRFSRQWIIPYSLLGYCENTLKSHTSQFWVTGAFENE